MSEGEGNGSGGRKFFAGNDRTGQLTIASVVFLGAFLLFQVQPLISRIILPWFGGSPSVWTSCLLFFQCLLCGGYLYSHLLTSRLPPAGQLWTHTLLILLSLVTLQILPDMAWKPDAASSPVGHILWVLARTVGVPYFLLSTTSPLLLRWYSLCYPERQVHRLYALSNTGSLLALLSYPLLVEPLLDISAQAYFWMTLFVLYGISSLLVLWMVRNRKLDATASQQQASARQSLPRRSWFLLSALASVMLLAETNQICQDVAVVPFFWVVPLALYLVSFIVCFESDRWYRRGLVAPLTALLVLGIALLQVFGTKLSLTVQLPVWSAGMFAIFLLCHGELARLRPPPDQLTGFYLLSSAGGAAGGLTVALLAPLLFPAYWEHDLGLLLSGLLGLAVWFDARGWMKGGFQPPLLPLIVGILMLVVMITMSATGIESVLRAKDSRRNFYGVLTVEDYEPEAAVLLRHGRITHGLQFRRSPSMPSTYYGYRSGAGRAIAMLRQRAEQEQRGLRIGLVGLGTGTLATYAQPGDEFVFYEINSDVIEIANEHFTFLRDCEAVVSIEEGDARLLLEHSESREFDLLVLDAFSGDSVPVHLLTVEAMEVYRRHLAERGLLVFHISNLHFDLQPVTEALADHASMAAVTIQNLPAGRGPDGGPLLSDPGSTWTLMSDDVSFLQHDLMLRDRLPVAATNGNLWRDSFANLLPILKWSGSD